MLRVGLTGGLGSGKSTVGRLFAELGAKVIDADEVGRKLMQPGEAVYARIVEQFGLGVARHDGSLDRRALAELAFNHGRLEELNGIVHPAVITAQEEWLGDVFAADPHAVAIIESALIFEASRGFSSVPGWRERFDQIILVTAPDELKIQRFVERSGGEHAESLAADARKRLAAQIPDAEKIADCDWVIENSGDMEATRLTVAGIYGELRAEAVAC
jgi:dephospho-CoA kinase